MIRTTQIAMVLGLVLIIANQTVFADSLSAVTAFGKNEFEMLASDETTAIGNYSLTLNGNTLTSDKESVIVTRDHGICLDWTQSMTDLTLLVWCIVPSVSTNSALMTLSAHSWSEESDLVGTTLSKTGDMSGIWLGKAYLQGEEGTLSQMGRPVCLALRYNGGLGYVGNTVGGTDFFVVDNENIVQTYRGVYLKRASARICGVTIGGTRGSESFASCAGLMITKIALFDVSLTADQIVQAASGEFSIGHETPATDISEDNSSYRLASWGNGDCITNATSNADFTLDINGNTISPDGKRLIITGERGVSIDWTEGKTNLTMLAWMTIPSVSKPSAIMTMGSDLVGVSLAATGITSGIWLANAYDDEGTGSFSSQGQNVCIALRYNGGTGYVGNVVGGTEMIAITNGVVAQVYKGTYLKRGYERIRNASIAGTKTSGMFSSISGCTISRIDIFDGWLEDAQVLQIASEVMVEDAQEGQSTDDSRYNLSDSTGDRTITSIAIDDDFSLDSIVVKNGKVYDAIIRIENTSPKKVRVTLPQGYRYETFRGMRPLLLPGHSTSILTITRIADKIFLVSREELELVK